MYEYNWSLCCRVTQLSAGEGILLTNNLICASNFILPVRMATKSSPSRKRLFHQFDDIAAIDKPSDVGEKATVSLC